MEEKQKIYERVEDYALSKKDRPKVDFSKIGIVGCGTTGQSIAIMVASRGMDVVFIELNNEKIQQSLSEISDELLNKQTHWVITEGEVKSILSKIKGTTQYKDLEGCDLVIESILSNNRENSRDIRKEVFLKIEEFVSPQTIIATNSTTLAITELASVLKQKDRCVSLHISTTSPDAKLVEIASSLYTSDETCKNVQKFSILLGKKFIKVEESPGLITVRLFAPMINEACNMLMEGITSMENIDFAAVTSLNLPLGPFEMADKIGIDRVNRWLDNMYAEFGDLQFKASPILRKLERAKSLGRKVHKGFYNYDEKGNKIGPSFKR